MRIVIISKAAVLITLYLFGFNAEEITELVMIQTRHRRKKLYTKLNKLNRTHLKKNKNSIPMKLKTKSFVQ